MITCTTCKGEGKVRTAPEERNATLTAARAFAATWGRRLAMVLGAAAVTPAVTSAFFGLGRFYIWLLDQPLKQGSAELNEHGYVVGINPHAGEVAIAVGVLSSVGLMLGAIATGFAVWAIVEHWSEE